MSGSLSAGRDRAEDVGPCHTRVWRDSPVLPVLDALRAAWHFEAQSTGHFGGSTERIDQLGILMHGGSWLAHAAIKHDV